MKTRLNTIEFDQFNSVIETHYGNALQHMTESDDKFRIAVMIIPCMVQKLKQDFPIDINCGYTPTNVDTYLNKDDRMLNALYCRAADLGKKHMEMLMNVIKNGNRYRAFTKTSMTDIDHLNILIHATTLDLGYSRLRSTVIALWEIQAWDDIVGRYMAHTYEPNRID